MNPPHVTLFLGPNFCRADQNALRYPSLDGSLLVVEACDVRIDKWLWAARVFKTRSLALEACRAGHVKIGGQAVKPSRPVHVGETIVVQTVALLRTLRVVGVSDRRVGARLTPSFFEDLTPPEELEKTLPSVAQQVLRRPKGSGRPTKRDRRLIEKFLP